MVYLDDSNSMIYKCLKQVRPYATSDDEYTQRTTVVDSACLNTGRMLLRGVCENLDGYPTRILNFGGETDYFTTKKLEVKGVLLERTRSVAGNFRSVADGWAGQSGSTYMVRLRSVKLQ